MKAMLEKGWLGSKTGQGFLLKRRKEILELNHETFEYEREKETINSIHRNQQTTKRITAIN